MLFYTKLLEKKRLLQEFVVPFMPYAPSASNSSNIKFVLVNKSILEFVTKIDKNNAKSIKS